MKTHQQRAITHLERANRSLLKSQDRDTANVALRVRSAGLRHRLEALRRELEALEEETRLHRVALREAKARRAAA